MERKRVNSSDLADKIDHTLVDRLGDRDDVAKGLWRFRRNYGSTATLVPGVTNPFDWCNRGAPTIKLRHLDSRTMFDQGIRVLLHHGKVEQQTHAACRALRGNAFGVHIEIHKTIIADGNVFPRGCECVGRDRETPQDNDPSLATITGNKADRPVAIAAAGLSDFH